jgi:hypothetical protein
MAAPKRRRDAGAKVRFSWDLSYGPYASPAASRPIEAAAMPATPAALKVAGRHPHGRRQRRTLTERRSTSRAASGMRERRYSNPLGSIQA